jgi:hypothetical protein
LYQSENQVRVRRKTYSQLSGSLNPSKCVGELMLNIAAAFTLASHLPVTSALFECSMGTNSCQVCVAPVLESQLYILQTISTKHDYRLITRKTFLLLQIVLRFRFVRSRNCLPGYVRSILVEILDEARIVVGYATTRRTGIFAGGEAREIRERSGSGAGGGQQEGRNDDPKKQHLYVKT